MYNKCIFNIYFGKQKHHFKSISQLRLIKKTACGIDRNWNALKWSRNLGELVLANESMQKIQVIH